MEALPDYVGDFILYGVLDGAERRGERPGRQVAQRPGRVARAYPGEAPVRPIASVAADQHVGAQDDAQKGAVRVERHVQLVQHVVVSL